MMFHALGEFFSMKSFFYDENKKIFLSTQTQEPFLRAEIFVGSGCLVTHTRTILRFFVNFFGGKTVGSKDQSLNPHVHQVTEASFSSSHPWMGVTYMYN
jgi:hypothetical protein